MRTIHVNGQDIAVTEHGFLQDLTVWNESVAEILAAQAGIRLTTDHWQVIYFMRKFYQEFQIIPPLRIFIKNLAASLGTELGNSITLHQLFPDSPIKYICMIAGLPKPKHCM